MTKPPNIKSLTRLAKAESLCRRCPLYRHATQVVPGEGQVRARIMMVGEQPGDKEDIAGKPFVGPAGRILDQAIEDAGLSRGEVFVTNAVKHFKFTPRGKRRLHKRPNAYEIDRCHWWLDLERAIVKPEVIVALGATAVRSITGRPQPVGKLRGKLLALDGGGRLLTTIHPSYVLRIRDDDDRYGQFKALVADLKLCRKALSG